MKDGFDFKELQKYVEDLKKATAHKEFETWLKQFMLQQAQRVIASAKRSSPVDTGALRASWAIDGQQIALQFNDNGSITLDAVNTREADISNVSDDFSVIISNGMEYASYVEYGHSTRAGNWIEGHFMLTIAMDEVEKAMPKRFEAAFIKYMKERGIG